MSEWTEGKLGDGGVGHMSGRLVDEWVGRLVGQRILPFGFLAEECRRPSQLTSAALLNETSSLHVLQGRNS